MSDAIFEIRCLWSKTDYGHISLLAAARGYGGKTLGSYQDGVINERFENLRQAQLQSNPDWRVVESVIKVSEQSIQALFTDGTEIPVID